MKDGFEMNLLWQTTVPNSDSSGADWFVLNFGDETFFLQIILIGYQNGKTDASAVKLRSSYGRFECNFRPILEETFGAMQIKGFRAFSIMIGICGSRLVLNANGSGILSLSGETELDHDILSWSFNALDGALIHGWKLDSG